LDSQLEMLLMADQSADAGFEVKDISAALPTQSVYDPEVDGMGSVQYVKGNYRDGRDYGNHRDFHRSGEKRYCFRAE
jgi:hypothetical protein